MSTDDEHRTQAMVAQGVALLLPVREAQRFDPADADQVLLRMKEDLAHFLSRDRSLPPDYVAAVFEVIFSLAVLADQAIAYPGQEEQRDAAIRMYEEVQEVLGSQSKAEPG